LAQAGIRLNVLSVNMGQGDGGVNFPAGQGADYSDGFDATLAGVITATTSDENALFSLKDADQDSVDVFYVDFSTATEGAFGVRGFQFRKGRNQTGDIRNQNSLVMSSNREVFTLPHELMHVLLN